MSKTIYQISEYGSFITGRQLEGYTTLPPTIFEQLENFILSSKNVSSTHTFHKFFDFLIAFLRVRDNLW